MNLVETAFKMKAIEFQYSLKINMFEKKKKSFTEFFFI